MKPRKSDWLVCDMDIGALRRERTRRAALKWAMNHSGHDKVYGRHGYGPGAYEYSTGPTGDPENRTGWFIERAHQAARSGCAGIDRPLYPYADRPRDADPEVEADLDVGRERSWKHEVRTEGRFS